MNEKTDLSENDAVATKNALLKRLIGRHQAKDPCGQLISQRRGSTEAPLSFSQQRLWFLEQLEGKLTAYNMPFEWRIRGRLDVEALRRALEALVHRHESLRTIIKMRGDGPVQVVTPATKFELPTVELTLEPSQEREAELSRLAEIEAEHPFDLGRDLMLRGSVIKLSANEYVLLLTTHHVSSDGWSMRVLLSELGILYKAYCGGEKPSLMPLTLQYGEYAAWQRRQLTGERLSSLVGYWRKQLDGIAMLDLPTDRPRPAVVSYRGGRHEFEVPEDLAGRLQALGQGEGATLQMTLLAAYQLLLSRYTGQTDISVGIPISGRNRVELEGLIGFFVNTLVARTDLSGDPSFVELLARVREVSLDAFDNQDLPFERLVEELGEERRLDRNPLVQVSFQLRTDSGRGLMLEGTDALKVPSSSKRFHFDLGMELTEHEGVLSGLINYSTDLFDGSTIERMVGHYMMLLESVVDAPDRRVGELPILTDRERRQILIDWNDTAVDYPSRCVHQLFEEQAERVPNAVALVFERQEMTYQELNDRANQLAYFLRDQGVDAGALVGVCLEHGIEMVVCVLGILKVGGGYLPIETSLPLQRLEFILRDSGCSLLVTRDMISKSIESGGTKHVCLGDNWLGTPSIWPTSNLGVTTDIESLVYVIYTSGTTGNPKGVLVKHGGLTNYVMWCRDVVGASGEGTARSVLHSSIGVDLTVTSLWPILCMGGTVVLAAATGIEGLLGILEKQDCSGLLKLTPTHLSALDPSLLGASHGVHGPLVIGGEELTSERLEEWRKRFPDLRIINEYGPTETTVGSCAYEIPSEMKSGGIPIGRPIANTQVYLLNECLVPVPIGVEGELFIGGAGLARGYLNRPELTVERFVSNPFEDDRRSLLYRTGDLCRWREDGNLEFLGRRDDQVKLRGFRIELGEIESVLNGNPKVSRSVVVLDGDQQGNKRLVAYYVPRLDKPPGVDELGRMLQMKLPDYMVPSAFVMLDDLPLTISGKIDRRALPAADVPRSEVGSGYVAPSTPLEELLAKVWSDVLGVPRVGVHDNFFALGGHSLLAIRLVSRIRAKLGLEIPVRVIFERATVGELSSAMLALELNSNESLSN